jgi:hypothetical protein
MSATGSRWAGAVLALVATPSFARDGKPSLADVPPVDRAQPHFYNAVAAAEVRVGWAADPLNPAVGGDVTLTLAVRGAANPAELRKPDLRQLPRLIERFQLLDRPDPPPSPDADEVRFTYTLRPRQPGRVEVPALRYAYYRPGLADGRRFQTAYAEPLALTVAPQPATAAPAVPLDGPEEFFRLASDRGRVSVPGWAWVLPPLLVPVAVAAWVLGWRRLFPAAARRAKVRRVRAVRTALDRLKRAPAAPDPAAEAAAAVRGYLAGRFNLPPAARTPAEIGLALRSTGQPGPVAGAAVGFLAACDAARFAGRSDIGLTLVGQAEALVVAMEEDEV